jgi:GTP-binding protein LepA
VKNIRNFSIIAHIDHGKSTLADRLMLEAGVVTEREFRNQLLDDMDLERERGITIKARSVRMEIEIDEEDYIFNLIDTPGHVDFSYEVSRSLAACEGAIMLVDAAQGVQAQTVANVYLAIDQNVELIPVLNKVDLPTARVDEIIEELNETFGFTKDEIILVSAKTGQGVQELLREIIKRVPAPDGDLKKPSRAMIIDSQFDDYKGVMVYTRMLDGSLTKGDSIEFFHHDKKYEITELMAFRPQLSPLDVLTAGNVGVICANIKSLEDVSVGDTLVGDKSSGVEPFPGFQKPAPMVFCGFYPVQGEDFKVLGIALEKLHLNDASFTYSPESSVALGFGFRCGFLGLLHMEIIQERLEREYDLDLVKTSPNVTYKLVMVDGTESLMENPSKLPDRSSYDSLHEPMVHLKVLVPKDAIGLIMTLCTDRRGIYQKQEFIGSERVMIEFKMPLSEIIYDFYDKLKSSTRGYGTMDYEFKDFEKADLVKMDILVNSMHVDALCTIVHRSNSNLRGRKIIKKLRSTIPRHLFEIPLQAALGGKIIARETIRALAKNVTAKCYGGDVSRKKKLLEKQKKGKKRMKQVGNVTIPQEAFLSVLSDD